MMPASPFLELWPESNFHLLKKQDSGFLCITDEFLREYFLRPELNLVAESCPAERTLHASLLEAPYRTVPTSELNALSDRDVAENYAVMLEFRDRLLGAETIEGCYLSAFNNTKKSIPFVFLNHMVALICQSIFQGQGDPYRLRASELLFRKQAINIHEGAILSIDHETASKLEQRNSNLGILGRSIIQDGVIPNPNEMDVLNDDNAGQYHQRSKHFDFVLDLTFERPGLGALCRVMEQWMRHLLMVDVTISPLREIIDEHWVWHTGLDINSSALLNDLYQNHEISNDRKEQILSLFRLEFSDTAAIRKDIVGRPVYMALSMDSNKRVLFKPQNLLFNMPLLSALN